MVSTWIRVREGNDVVLPQRPVYRAALIGCGSMGSYYMDELIGLKSHTILPIGHAEVLKTNPRTELIAGADPDAGRREDFGRRWEVGAIYADHREMLEKERPEIVSIASPPDVHAQHVIDCANAGVKGIFCEKPLAPTLKEADELLAACANAGVKLSINHTRRGNPWILRARELIDAGELGDILTITMTWAGRLFLSGTHCYDLVNYFAGDAPTAWLTGHAEVPTAEMKVVPTQRGVDVGGTAYVVYENGIRAFLNGRDGNVTLQTQVYGTKGMLVLDDHEAQLWALSDTGGFRELAKVRFPQMMRYTAPMVYLLEDLIAAIDEDREPMSNGRHARHALTQILATHASSRNNNQRIDFPYVDVDARPPYQWFSADGEAVYHATPRPA
jgi:predicted dehydrogenase